MYVSLYRKYRPQTFSDMVGQSAAVGVLQESLREGRLGHAYLFSGPRGCGKTSAARLVAKSLNCLNPRDGCEPCGECENCIGIAAGEHLDVIEIDGASNRGIDNIRDLRSQVNLKPLSSKYKVYIIDEVHMLTEAAFNALLKTLEEPPANVVFLLATTEPHKVPVTIRSRCQHIPFHRISIADMVKRLGYVCGCENISSEPEALWELARQADGALRDALSLAEQAIALGRGSLTLASVRDLTGGSNRTDLERWVSDLRTEPVRAAAGLQTMLSHGISIERLTESLFSVFRDLWMYSEWGPAAVEALEVSDAERLFLENESKAWQSESLRQACLFCNGMLPRARYGMRLEVFSGLVMLQLTSIAQGKPVAYVQPRQQAVQAPVVTQRVQQPAQPPVPRPVPQPERRESPAAPVVPPSQAEPAAPPLAPLIEAAPAADIFAAMQPPQHRYDTAQLCARLGDGPLSQLVGALEEDQIAIAAALLHCDLVRTEQGWNALFTERCPAEVFLAAPATREILAAAIEKIWHVRDDANTQSETTAATPPAPLSAAAGAAPAPQPVQRQRDALQPSVSLGGGADRLLKLMGAEILYVDDHEGGEEEQEGMD